MKIRQIVITSVFFALYSVALFAEKGHEHAEHKNHEHEKEQQIHEDNEKEHDEHEGHDHKKEHGEHEGHNHEKKHSEQERPDHQKLQVLNTQSSESEHEHGHDSHSDEEPSMVKLSEQQQRMAGIQVSKVLQENNLQQLIKAPGEVVSDLYHTTLISTQVDSKVLSRKVVLGQHIKQGQEIAVLYSVDLATAQNQLKVSRAEWLRVRKLGEKTVGAQRYIEAQAAYEKDQSLLLAYGYSKTLLKQFIAGKSSYLLGQYPVWAPHDGVVLEDNFQTGQYLLTGSPIVLLVNEEQVWVEALLPPQIGQDVPVGSLARVEISGRSFPATVIHDSHAIDEITRTRKIRLKVDNSEHLLHAGLFAEVQLQIPVADAVMLLPETALMLSSDGDWNVFIETQPGVFQQTEVEIGKSINGLQSVHGLVSGQKIAVTGAFFLASELAKGGFDPHNH